MNIRQLEVFRAVMEAGSATAAGRLLELSQSSVSRLLMQLEEDVGLDLFVREHGKLVPTANATAFSREVSHAFEGVERVLNLARKMRANNTGTLRIAVPPSFCEALLPRVIMRLKAAHPDLRYVVKPGSYEEIASMVASREVDVGIIKDPVENIGISKLELMSSRLVCALSDGHLLAQRRVVRLEDFSGVSMVLLGQNKPWREDLQAHFRRANIRFSVVLVTHSVGAVCGFVASGLGVSIVPEILGAQYAGRGLVLRPLAVNIEQRFSVVFPKGLQRAGLVAEFAGSARHIIQELMREAKRGVGAAVFRAASGKTGRRRSAD